MSTISGFCEKCNGLRKRHCDGDRNTCMSILFDIIESLQQELDEWKYEVQCHMDEVIAREKQMAKMKPDGVSDNVYNDLINALEKAILLIYDMSIRKVAMPYDTIQRWENLVRYARKEGGKIDQ